MTLGFSQQQAGADNSNFNNEEPSLDDNSNDLLDEEPVNDNEGEDADNGDDADLDNQDQDENNNNQEELILGKFKNVDDLAKSYEEKEKLSGTQSVELGELRKKAERLAELERQQDEVAKMYGFNSAQELENHQAEVKYKTQIAKIEADEYIKHLRECEYPDEVKNLLIQYKENPSKELLDTIEAEFPIGVIKKVTECIADKKGQLQAQMQEAQNLEFYAHTENYLKDVTTRHADKFKNKEFVSLFGEAFKVLGANLDADFFIDKLENYGKSCVAEFMASKNKAKENQEATDAIEGASPKGASKTDNSGNEKNILDMTPDEIRKEVKKYKNL